MIRREERGLLDTVRWISALMVAFGHAWASLFARQDNLLSRAIWFVADTRHSWVIIFFVLSGYLVGGKALLRADNFNFKTYAVARFSRIYVVLIPALALTALLDGSAFLLAPHSPIYSGAWANGVFGDTPPFARYGPHEILASLLSLENAIGAPMGSDGPLWSLGFEWMFYFCFPALLLSADAVSRRTRLNPWLGRGAALLVSAGLLVVTHRLYAGLLWMIWISGAVAHVVTETGKSPSWVRWIGALACMVGFGLTLKVDYHFSDAVIGFGFAAFLSLFPAGEKGLAPAVDTRLSLASYSLYLIHLPVIAYLCMIFNSLGLLKPGGAPMGLAGLAMLVCVAAVVALMTTLFYITFESRTDVVRAGLHKLLQMLRPATA